MPVWDKTEGCRQDWSGYLKDNPATPFLCCERVSGQVDRLRSGGALVGTARQQWVLRVQGGDKGLQERSVGVAAWSSLA